MNRRNLILLSIILIVGGLSVYFLGRIKIVQSPPKLFPKQKTPAISLVPEIPLYLEKHLNEIAPEKAPSGQEWKAQEIDLIDDSHFYVTYTSDKVNRRLLLEKRQSGWEILGYFKPGKDIWLLASGKDPYFSAPLTIYKKNSEGQWQLVR